jgi:uncharacterized protein YdhG (YjbR/CyaY superfamily)
MDRPTAKSVDEYIAAFTPATQKVLEQVRSTIRAAAPGAVETISYSMPTFDLHGRHLVHFAGYARHLGLYPMPSAIEAFGAELAVYHTAKGSIQFPLDRPLPEALIRRIVEFRVGEVEAKASKPKGAKG